MKSRPTHHLKTRSASPGFTLVELMIAMAVFSFVMVMISIGVLQVMRIYQANLATRRTQQAARIVVDDITREIRSASEIAVAEPNRLCLQGANIVEYERKEFPGDAQVLYKRIRKGSCANPTGIIEERELVGASSGGSSDVQVRRFTASPIGSSGQIDSAKVAVGVTTGRRELLDASTGLVCQPGPGSQYCGAASYIIMVTPRKGEQ